MNLSYHFQLSPPNQDQASIATPPSTLARTQNLNDNTEIRVIRTRINSRTNTTKYHYNWNKIEERRYIQFLVKQRELFDLTRDERKCLKINKLMGTVIKTRSAAQCHTHHQKMVIKYGSIEDVIRAHLHYIPKQLMRIKLKELYQELYQEEDKKNREVQAIGESSGELRDNSQPYWRGLVNFQSSSDPFFGFPVFPEDASYLI